MPTVAVAPFELTALVGTASVTAHLEGEGPVDVATVEPHPPATQVNSQTAIQPGRLVRSTRAYIHDLTRAADTPFGELVPQHCQSRRGVGDAQWMSNGHAHAIQREHFICARDPRWIGKQSLVSYRFVRECGRLMYPHWATSRHSSTGSPAIGPGAIHLLNGLYGAKMDYQPVLAIVGQSGRNAIGGDFQQEVDLHSLFKDVAHEYVHTAMSAAQVRHLIERAIRIACVQRAVTCLVFPHDVQELELIVTDGFTCREQIALCAHRRAYHLAEVLRMGLS